jgi:sodium-dependent phosphate transporter
MRSLGNKITQVSPTRGFAMELGAAITVLLASRLGLPVVSASLQHIIRSIC